MLGDLIPVMTGVAIGGRYLGQKIVTMTWIGDGGSSTGVFHEGLNFAAVQKAPFVLILENNLWAYSTPVRKQVPLENFADRAKAYGIDSYIVDGNDVVAVYSTAKEAVERARAGEGPILIEAKSFRRMGHAQHDPAEYVPKEMRSYWGARDPILLYEKYLTSEKLLDAKGKKEIDDKIDALLQKERDFAENTPMPPAQFTAKGPEVIVANTNGQKTNGSTTNGAATNAGPVTFLEAIKQAMFEEMERDPAVVVIGEDVGVYGGAFKTSEGLLQRFGWERVIDTPISESAIIGAACGMSYCGLRPICEMQFIDFIVCAFNQITNFVAKGHYLWNAPAPIDRKSVV